MYMIPGTLLYSILGKYDSADVLCVVLCGV